MRSTIEDKENKTIKSKGTKPIMAKIMIVFSMISVMLVSTVGCQSPLSPYPDPKAYLSEDRDQKWINDINYLEETLPRVHKNLYFKQDQDYFIGSLNTLKEKVPEYTDNEINIKMATIVSEMGDTHTHVNMGFDKQYPFSLYWYDEGIYIVDTTEDYKDLLYSKIVTLNDKPIEEVAEAFRPFFTGANDQWFKNQVMYYIPGAQLLKYFGVIEEDTISLKLETLDGKVKEVDMMPITNEEVKFIEDESVYHLPLYKHHPDKYYWYEYLPEEKTLYVSFRSAREMLDKPFVIFTDEVFEFIKEQQVDKLVVDLRENQGGDGIFNPFIEKLKKSNLNEKDHLFVVMGRKTYSAGLNAVIALKQQTNATIIGENSGGRPNHYGQTKAFRLPNSQIGVSYSTRYIKGLKEDVEYLEPDVAIGVSFSLEREGKDAVMEWVEER